MKIKGKLRSGKLSVARDSQYLTLCIALPRDYTNSADPAEWKLLLSSANLKNPGDEHEVDVKLRFSDTRPPVVAKKKQPDDAGERSEADGPKTGSEPAAA
jgi:hypothetical protein